MGKGDFMREHAGIIILFVFVVAVLVVWELNLTTPGGVLSTAWNGFEANIVIPIYNALAGVNPYMPVLALIVGTGIFVWGFPRFLWSRRSVVTDKIKPTPSLNPGSEEVKQEIIKAKEEVVKAKEAAATASETTEELKAEVEKLKAAAES
jgi:hypothetical protein